MDRREHDRFLENLKMAVTRDAVVVGLVRLQMADATPDTGDRHQDTIWIITGPNGQARFLDSMDWVPESAGSLLVQAGSGSRRSLLFRGGYRLDIGVFDLAELSRQRVGEYRVLFDRGGVNRLLDKLERRSRTEAELGEGRLEKVCAHLDRAVRGWSHHLPAEAQEASGQAATLAIEMAAGLGVDLSESIAQALALETPTFAITLLTVLRKDLSPLRPHLPWDAAGQLAAEYASLDSQDTATTAAPAGNPGPVLATNEPDRCQRCGDTELKTGRFYKKGTLEEIRFLPTDAPRLSLKHEVDVIVCGGCGHASLHVLPKPE